MRSSQPAMSACIGHAFKNQTISVSVYFTNFLPFNLCFSWGNLDTFIFSPLTFLYYRTSEPNCRSTADFFLLRVYRSHSYRLASAPEVREKTRPSVRAVFHGQPYRLCLRTPRNGPIKGPRLLINHAVTYIDACYFPGNRSVFGVLSTFNISRA